jgi:dTDP-4-dehydrorhamnose reductase
VQSRLVGATGLTGLIGSRIHEVTRARYEWVNFRLSTGVDITDYAAAAAAIASFAGDSIVHLAAFTNADEAWRQKGDRSGACYQINVIGTQNLARACARSHKHLMYISTSYVFKGEKNQPHTEEDAPDPIDWYGQTKCWAEEAVQAAGCAFTIIRLDNPFRTAYPGKGDIIRKILEGIRAKSLRPQFADTIITPTYVDDIAYAVEKLLLTTPGGIFHITGGAALSPFALAQKTARIFGLDAGEVKRGSLTEYLTVPTNRPYPRYLHLSNQKAAKELGITMRTLDECLDDLRLQQQLLQDG